MSTLLEVNDLKTYFYTTNGVVPSVDGVSFSLESGQTTALVGESGCGKSVTSFSIMQLVSAPGKIIGGEIMFKGKDLTKLNDNEMRKIRGNEISMIFQEPLTSLNPILKIGAQLDEILLLHETKSKTEAKNKSIEMLKMVGMPRAEQVYDMHPHELSGGMRQRVMIAMALSCNPSLLIADEPTTALDVTIQAQILRLMRNLKKEFQTSILLITHDLGVVAELADKVIVMYAGQVVEEADVMSLFAEPQHPYTQGLIQSTPKIDAEEEVLNSIPGNVPAPDNKPSGCYFHPRCPFAMDICKKQMPDLKTNEQTGNKVRCWLYKSQKEG